MAARDVTTVDCSRATWRKSTRSSGNGECVEVAAVLGAVAIRDSKHPNGPSLAVTPAAWRALTEQAKLGVLDR